MSIIEYVKDVIDDFKNSKKFQAEVDARNVAYEKEMARRELESKLDKLMEPVSYLELKEWLKEQVAWFREHGTSMHKGYWDRNDYRYHHIAYSLMRGRTMEQIEPKVHPQNKLHEYELKKIDEIKSRCTSKEIDNVKG